LVVRDEEDLLAAPQALPGEGQAERGLAGTRGAHQAGHAAAFDAPHHLVQARYPPRKPTRPEHVCGSSLPARLQPRKDDEPVAEDLEDVLARQVKRTPRLPHLERAEGAHPAAPLAEFDDAVERTV